MIASSAILHQGRVVLYFDGVIPQVGRARFGMMPPALEVQPHSADEATLTAIFARAVQAASVEELLAPGR